MNERIIPTNLQTQHILLYRILTVDDHKTTDPKAHLLAVRCLRRLMTQALYESFVSLAKSQGFDWKNEDMPNSGRVMLTWDWLGGGWAEYDLAIEIMLAQALEALPP